MTARAWLRLRSLRSWCPRRWGRLQCWCSITPLIRPAARRFGMVLHEKGVKFDEVPIDLGKREQLKPDISRSIPTVWSRHWSMTVCRSLIERDLRISRRKISAKSAGPLESARTSTDAGLDALHRRGHSGSHSGPFLQPRLPVSLRKERSEAIREEEIGPRPVRRELFQRMGSPKGFSKQDIDRSLEQLTETCRRMDAAIAKTRPVADGRAIHALPTYW